MSLDASGHRHRFPVIADGDGGDSVGVSDVDPDMLDSTGMAQHISEPFLHEVKARISDLMRRRLRSFTAVFHA